MKKLIFFLLVVLLFGCAGTGPKYSELSQEMNSMQDNKARIVVFRTGDSSIPGPTKPSVNINNNKIGELALETFVYADVPSGTHFIETQIFDKPGSCKIALTAARGKTYYFIVDLRYRNFDYFLADGLAKHASEVSLIKCTGNFFALYPVDEDTAAAKIYNLRLTK
jgi:hypothetical protein